jgi:hypothetical protein
MMATATMIELGSTSEMIVGIKEVRNGTRKVQIRHNRKITTTRLGRTTRRRE